MTAGSIDCPCGSVRDLGTNGMGRVVETCRAGESCTHRDQWQDGNAPAARPAPMVPAGATTAERFLDARVRRNLTVAELSAASGVHPGVIKNIEIGKEGRTRSGTKARLAHALGTTVDLLFAFDVDEPSADAEEGNAANPELAGAETPAAPPRAPRRSREVRQYATDDQGRVITGARLRDLRRELGWTIDRVSREARLSVSAVLEAEGRDDEGAQLRAGRRIWDALRLAIAATPAPELGLAGGEPEPPAAATEPEAAPVSRDDDETGDGYAQSLIDDLRARLTALEIADQCRRALYDEALMRVRQLERRGLWLDAELQEAERRAGKLRRELETVANLVGAALGHDRPAPDAAGIRHRGTRRMTTIYLVKRGPREPHHLAPFHPVIICAKRAVAKREAGWTGDAAWVWSHERGTRGGGWLLERWNGFDVDYGHVVRGVTMPDGTEAAFVHEHTGRDPWPLIAGAVWWDDKPMPRWIADAGVVYPPDGFSQRRILDVVADDGCSGFRRARPAHWPEPAAVEELPVTEGPRIPSGARVRLPNVGSGLERLGEVVALTALFEPPNGRYGDRYRVRLADGSEWTPSRSLLEQQNPDAVEGAAHG